MLTHRLWTADRLQARQCDHHEKCLMCDQVLESAGHLLLLCPYAKEIWHLGNFGANYAVQAARSNSIKSWWNKLTQVPKKNTVAQKDITLAAYVVWNIWKERNRRIFENKNLPPHSLWLRIIEENDEYNRACCR